MNCSQARAMLAEYRELKNAGAAEHAAGVMPRVLEAHLADCAACQQILAQQQFIGEQLRSLPSLEPSATAHSKLMQALAEEHVRYLQSTSPADSPPPTPMFLMPYLREQIRTTTPRTGPLTALATADTGPLPVVQPVRRRPRRSSHHLAIIGLAAAFLIVLMTGGLTSLLLMANQGIPPATITSIYNPTQISLANYTATTSYPHVASAVANRDAIYYAARGDGSTGWMVERFDVNNKTVTPLLKTESSTPLLVLSCNQDWLVWLELGALKPSTTQHTGQQAQMHKRGWELRALYLGPTQSGNQAAPVTLSKGTFNESTTPAWIHTPIQGTWFIQNSLLVARVDDKGNSQLLQYRLNPQKIAAPTQIASASNGHILTSPTANGTGSNIYWAEEWQSNDEALHSNIWTQENATVAPTHAGQWAPRSVSHVSLLRDNGMSFHPQVANDTLFFLSTSPGDAPDGPQATAQASATATQAAVTQPTSSATSTVPQRVEQTFNASQVDEMVQGTLMSYSPLGAQPMAQANTGQEFAPQGGSRFLLWENSTGGFEMYDVVARISVSVSNAIPKDAAFLTVNGDSVVWMSKEPTDKNTGTPSAVTFSTFNWPTAPTTQP
ncbi:MAG: hypothetical protein J2P37_17175 [Ktedonobacteraceae bacterium]|nr:hypothetical protein [Ktedonobacteraceae bacterium]